MMNIEVCNKELDDCLTIQKNNDTAYYDVLEAINDFIE